MARARAVRIIACWLLLGSLATSAAQADAETHGIADVVAKVSPAVVHIVVIRTSGPKAPSVPTKIPVVSEAGPGTTAVGSGFIIDPSGFIATNRHVVEDARSVFVITADGIRYEAAIVNILHKVDIALLRIDAGHDLPWIPFGDSDAVRAGDRVIAIGNPYGFDNSVTAGIVSAVNRDVMDSPFDNYFQTDAATNQGNSGGPLLNLAGQVIGMVSFIVGPSSGWAGLSFAIPSNDLRFVFGRLITTGEIRAGMLPIHTQEVGWMLAQALEVPSLEGALVAAVNDDADATLKEKLKAGDIIVSFNGLRISDPRDLARKVAQAAIGSEAELELLRNGRHETVQVTVQGWPESKRVAQPKPRRDLGLLLSGGPGDGGKTVVRVVSVDVAGTAADSGLQPGDIILEVQQDLVTEPDQAMHLLQAQSAVGRSFAAVLVERDKKRLWVPVALPD